MTTIKRFSLSLVLTLFALVLTAQAQTPSIEVSADTETVEFSAQGVTRKVHVEVYAPSGELVFETGDSDGQSIRWGMTNQRGERVADGVYLATITVVDSLGKKRKRIEQITVSSPQYAAQPTGAPQESLAPTGAGTAGKIAKWTTAANLGNSVITEGTGGRIGVNAAAPVATLQVNGLQPPPLATNGTPAPALLQTSGGKGGNTTAAGKVAGNGASISLVAGNGGDGPSGSFAGKGGNITLQPGSPGAVPGVGGKGGGSVLLAPSGVGNVGVGTNNPLTPLHVVSANSTPPRLQSNGTTSFGAGWDFYHGTAGKGYVGVPGTGVGEPGPGELMLYGAAGVKTSLWAGATRAITIDTLGRIGIGTTPLSYARLAVAGDAKAPEGISGIGYGSGSGVSGYGTISHGVYGKSASTSLSSTSAGIYGFNINGGWAGYFNGPVRVTGTFNNSSDRDQKANISAVDPRSILRKLAGVPVQAWNYKTEPATIRHLGPMAQDFRAAFGLGTDDKSISTVDIGGVSFAAIQALYQMMLEKDKQIETLNCKVEQQGRRNEQLQSQLDQVRRTIRRRRAR